MYDVGVITFLAKNVEEIIGFGIFVDGQCMKYIYNEHRAQELMDENFGNLYQLPETLSESIAGCEQKFWDEFLARSVEGAFLQFEKIKQYNEEDLKQKVGPLLIDINKKLLNE